MKKITIMLLAVLFLCVPCMTAFAETSEQNGAVIHTTVPSTCRITFVSNGGRIAEGGRTMDGTESFERRSEHTFQIIPTEGKAVDRILIDGEDMTSQLENGCYTMTLTKDLVFEVTYKEAASHTEPVSEAPSVPTKPEPSVISDTPRISEAARTGDTTTVAVFVIAVIAAVSVASGIALAKTRRKET